MTTVMHAPMLTSSLLQSLHGINHGFFTRIGGVSASPWDSLNCSFDSGDDAGHVSRNRERVASGFGIDVERLYTLRQVHGEHVVFADRERPAGSCEGDALVSSTPGILVGVLTADCVPVLMADVEAGVVAAAHAGWRGALAGVVESAIEGMQGAGATCAGIQVAIGPAIQQSSYEVGQEVYDAVHEASDFNTDYLFHAVSERYLFDLPGLVRARCIRAGITLIENLGADTRSEPENFFSYRRTCLLGEAEYGRQISVIGLA
jgi:polyphenol oxidase